MSYQNVMSRFRLICLLLVLVIQTSLAQKALVLEKGASLHSRKYFIGDQLVYKLKSDQKQWLEEYISDIYVDEGYLLLDNRIVLLDQIAAIQIRDGGQFARTMSQLITRFGYSWGFWTLVSAGFGDKITPATIGIGVGSILAGQLL